MPTIAALTIDNFARVLGREPALVVYFAASWCQPCQAMQPVFAEAARRLAGSGIQFGTVDIAVSPTVAQTHGIRAVPSIAVFQQGRLVDLLAGHQALDAVLRRVQAALAPVSAGG